jgi:TubC N-terminal docking domain
MTATDCIARLTANGVRLWLDGDRLRYSAPRDALTRELREAVTANRAEIIRRLQDEPLGMVVPEPLASFNAIERCYNGNCGAMAAFKAGRGFCKRCGVYQRVIE